MPMKSSKENPFRNCTAYGNCVKDILHTSVCVCQSFIFDEVKNGLEAVKVTKETQLKRLPKRSAQRESQRDLSKETSPKIVPKRSYQRDSPKESQRDSTKETLPKSPKEI